MKILIHTDIQLERTKTVLEYLRNTYFDMLPEVILVDYTGTDIINAWATGQKDFTYVYFDEKVTPGMAFNQVIEGLEINDDVLISDNYHIPLINSFQHLFNGLHDNADAFAVGPVSNSFLSEQHIDWSDAEDALSWSERNSEASYEEMLFLYPGVILFKKEVICAGKTFCEEDTDFENMITEKCVREFMKHGRMYICRCSGFWDLRGTDYRYIAQTDNELLEKKYGIHYLNIRGNDSLIDILKEYNKTQNDTVRVLEIGCDCGGTLFRIKKQFDDVKLFGTDINEAALKYASEFADVKINNIEDYNLDFGENDFDIIIFGDVLEHLRNPLEALLFCKKLLRPGGIIAASIPNLMNIEVMKYLLDGFFPYAEYGLLDKTHIHMFTYNEIIKIFGEAGYIIEKMSMVGSLDGENEKLADELVRLGKAEKFMYQAYQYQVVARLTS